jgi:sulfotransferase
MPRRYHFISGLPRSGSTLLAAILRQNPRFHAGMTSPVGGLFNNLIAQVSAGSELAPMVDTETRKRLLAGLFESYYADVDPEIAVVFDTNRGWTAALPSLVELFPDARVLCCVRDLGWVMDSLERQYRRNTFENTRLFNSPSERGTVYTRVEALAQPDRLVGYAHAALREACYGEHAARLLLIDYEFLTHRPREVIQLIYQFLDEPLFEHDFDNVAYDAEEFDAVLGVRGLHRVAPKVQPQKRDTILPPDLLQRFQQQNFWRDLQGSRANIITASGGG